MSAATPEFSTRLPANQDSQHQHLNPTEGTTIMTTQQPPKQFRSRVLLMIASLALLASACGGDVPIAASSDDAAAAQPAPAQGSTVGASSGPSELGDILVGEDGLTLYGFTNDTAAASTCTGTCADAWPPVIVGADWTVAPGLDSGIFATTTRDDGKLQLVAGKWPLYFFAGDVAPGDITGQGSGDVWFVVGTDGLLIKEAAPADGGADADAAPAEEAEPGELNLALAETDLGTVLVDPDGFTLYGFTEDVDGAPTCFDACADAWPPVLVDALPTNLNSAAFSVVERGDGTLQLRSGKWPLYRFAGDGAPGDINGQASGGVWFVVNADGGLIKDGAAAESGTDSSGSTDADTSEEDDGY